MKDAWSLWRRSAVIVAVTSALWTSSLEAQAFLRGDANGDGRVSLSDAQCVFAAGNGDKTLRCERAADVDTNGMVDDGFFLLSHVLGVGAPCPPFPEPGEDPESDLPCEDVTVRPPLEDPEAMIRIPEANADRFGRTVLDLFVTNSTAIAGYFVTIRMEGARFGEAIELVDLSGSLGLTFTGQTVFDGKLRVAFLSSLSGGAFIPPGDGQPVLEIHVCLEGGLEPDNYPMVLEDAEFVDFESNQAILPETEADDLEVAVALADNGCVSDPAPEVEPESPPDPDPPDPPEGPTLDFVRGDVNLDGTISITDAASIRRRNILLDIELRCRDAADVDDDGFFNIKDVVIILDYVLRGGPGFPPPFLEPGPDPTPADGLGCESDEIVPPNTIGDDTVSLGEVEATAGETVSVPVFLTSDAPIEAFQLVIQTDPPLFRPLELEPNMELFPDLVGGSFNVVRSLPGKSGVFVVGFIPALLDIVTVPPGEEQFVFAIRGEVAPNAEPGTNIELYEAEDLPRAGDGGEDHPQIRNELSSRGEARLPDVLTGLIQVTAVAILRGDTNHDGTVNIADAVALLNHLFAKSEAPRCADEADANDDGRVNIADATAILSSLFGGGAAIPPPFPDPGADPTEDDLPDCTGPAGG